MRLTFAALTLQILLTASSFAQTHKIRVSDPAEARQLEEMGATLLADYGGFQFYQVNQLGPEISGMRHVELRDDDNLINLNATTLDTTKPSVQALRKPRGTFTGKRMHLVQFVGPVRPEWRDDLMKAGVQIIDYIPANTYLVYGDEAALAQLQDIARTRPHIQWDGEYAAAYRIHPGARELGTDLFSIQLVADPEANPATLAMIDHLKLETIRPHDSVLHYVNMVVRLRPGDITTIADQPDVISIQPYFTPRKFDERQDQIIAGNLSDSAPTAPGYLAWLASKGFTQAQFTSSGFAVDLSDSGIDNGTTSPGHFGLYTLGDTNAASRIIYNRLEGTPNSGSTLQGCDGHGNINSHIISAYANLSNGFPHADSSGYLYDLGVCPFVNVGSSVIFDSATFTFPNYANLQSAAYNNGARISNNSWGATNDLYTTDSQTYDALVRDAQPSGSTYSVSGNQEMVIVFAAGNEGPGGSTVGEPGTAKNVITVGAAENVRSMTPANGGTDPSGNDGCDVPDSDAAVADDMAYFSSRGPCNDGRTKPDICAPGTHITGGAPQSSPPPSPSGTGSGLACFAGTGVCGLPGGGTTGNVSNYFPFGQQFYTESSGTSHSTPCVVGACALLRQYFINNSLTPPSPAMTKAFLVNSARYMTGSGANDTLPSNNQGMGELNLGTAFDGVSRVLLDELPIDIFNASGQTRTFIGTVTDNTKPFRVTLAWTDAPGSTTGNAYNNDLDLVVTVGTNTYLGNVFSGQYSTTGGSADQKDNVESVFLPAGVSGVYTVTVSAANINSDGVPGYADPLNQDFALVVYNGVAATLPVITTDGSTLLVESCMPTNGAIDPGETVTVDFRLQNIGTAATTNLVATLLATGGVTNPSSPQSYGVLAPGGGSAVQPFTFTANGNCGGIITATLQLQDGPSNYGTVSYNFTLGQLGGSTNVLAQNFDSVTKPALPSGWTTTATGAQSPWITTNLNADTSPNAAFSPDPGNVGVNELVSPTINIVSPAAQLRFRNNYQLEAYAFDNVTAFDGGVLEIKIGSGSFIDILAAGGSFITNGYNRTISSSYGNPLAGRQAWSGNSGGYITTIARLPANAAGQPVQLKWRCGSDNSVSKSGWYIDTISVSDSNFVCCSPPVPTADVAITKSASPNPVLTSQSLTYTLTVSNVGPSTATSVMVTDPVPASVSVVSAIASTGTCTNIGGVVVCSLGDMTSNGVATITIAGSPSATIDITNITNTATVSSGVSDPAPSNNTASATTTVWLDSVGDGIPDWWRQQYFGCVLCPQAAGTADPDGDGFTNAQEYQMGTNPTNPGSALRITSIVVTGSDVSLTWSTAGGHTNIVQAAPNLSSGYSNISLNIILPGSGDISTNYLDPGAATNGLTRFYRIKLVP